MSLFYKMIPEHIAVLWNVIIMGIPPQDLSLFDKLIGKFPGKPSAKGFITL